MKKIFQIVSLTALALVPTLAQGRDIAAEVKGKILLQVESHGEAWYVNPKDGLRYYLKNGDSAYQALKQFGLGVTNANLDKIPVGIEKRFIDNDSDNDGLADKLEEGLRTDYLNPDSDGDGFNDGIEVANGYDPLSKNKKNFDTKLANSLAGKILLQVESHGEAWYINPADGKKYYMKDGQAAYQIMRFLSLGITNNNLAQIPSGAQLASEATPTNNTTYIGYGDESGNTVPVTPVVPTPAPTPTIVQNPKFIDVSAKVGIAFTPTINSQVDGKANEMVGMSGGLAIGDYNEDGWPDVFIISGNENSYKLFMNNGGKFVDQTATAGLNLPGNINGPLFFDYNGDDLDDLFVGGVVGTQSHLLKNTGRGNFIDVTQSSGVITNNNTYSAAASDYDQDGDVDLMVAHWDNSETTSPTIGQWLFTNNGNETFTNDAGKIDLHRKVVNGKQYELSFSPNFIDINNDGWDDLLLAGDFGTSQVFLNSNGQHFTNITDNNVITDENGMGAAVGDYDNDGDVDWFISNIYDPNGKVEGNWGITGNRLYQNNGSGQFTDVTDQAGVRQGYWGWGSCMQDFNNDGYLDIFHVNGMYNPIETLEGQKNDMFAEYLYDPSRLFMSNRNGTFTEMAQALGINDTGQGRGIACFDYDRDGDIDILVNNSGQSPKLYQNQFGGNYITIGLVGQAPNTRAIGAKVFVTTGGITQMRQIQAGSNYLSQNLSEAHFGLPNANDIDSIRIVWPKAGAEETILQNVIPNRYLEIGE